MAQADLDPAPIFGAIAGTLKGALNFASDTPADPLEVLGDPAGALA